MERSHGGSERGARPVRREEVTPRRSSSVCILPHPVAADGLHKRLVQGQLLPSDDGWHVVYVARRTGNTCSVVHSSPDLVLPNTAFDQAMVLHVYADCAVKAWAVIDGTKGIWMITKNVPPRLIQKMDRVEAVLRSPKGPLIIGTFGDGSRVCVANGVTAVVPAGAKIVLDARGAVHGLVPLETSGRRSWVFAPAYGTGLLSDEAGSPMFALPFFAETVEPFLFNGLLMCILRDGGRDAFWFEGGTGPDGTSRAGGSVTEMTLDGTDGGVDHVWSSPDTSVLAKLLRVPMRTGGITRRLKVGTGTVLHEGSFYMCDADFRWSPNGAHYVARLRLLDTDGALSGHMVVSSDGRKERFRTLPHEPVADDDGRVALVIEDYGGMRVVAGSNMTPVYPYAWNVSFLGDVVVANVFVDGIIRRIEVPYGR